MNRKLTVGFILFILAALLAACGADEATKELEENDTEKAEAKTGDEQAETEKDATESEAETKEDDIWTYYEDANWSDDFNGLKSEIMKVVVTNEAPALDESGNEVIKSAVGVKFKLENTTDHKFTTYPDQAVLVTSTGEQIDMPDMFVSDSIGGEIDKGVIKEGNIIWYLERGEADKIEWIKMSWYAHEGDDMDFTQEQYENRKEYEVELKLK